MGTHNRVIQSEHEREMAARFVENKAYPFTLTVTDGKPRTKAQNRLQHKWMQEIAEQKGDCTADEARAYCKLTIGVPILRSQNAAFKERYDEILKPLSYEQKLAIMSEPLNLPVTSLMSTKQLTDYLEAIIRHFGEQGVVLTMPDDMRQPDQPHSGESSPSLPDTAGDPTSSSPAEEVSSPLTSSTLSDEEWLQTATRMLWAATNVKGDAEANLSTLNAQRLAVGDIEANPSQSTKDKAGSIYKLCKRLVMREINAGDALDLVTALGGFTTVELEVKHG